MQQNAAIFLMSYRDLTKYWHISHVRREYFVDALLQKWSPVIKTNCNNLSNYDYHNISLTQVIMMCHTLFVYDYIEW